MAHNFNYLIKSAISNELFYLAYQPVVDTEQNIIGYETFLRWPEGEMEDIPSEIFWELLEVSDEISLLNSWFFTKLIKDVNAKPELGLQNLFINLSFSQIQDASFRPQLQIIRPVIKLENIIFDISEKTLMSDSDFMSKTMTELAQKGLRFALDDFGAGYSSFKNLKVLPLDYLKIDNEFISKINEDPKDKAIVKACMELANAMGLATIAEGVETKEQFELLSSMGIRYAQGYYFGRPSRPL